MADNTAIEWTDATWNPITGCSIVSPGCTNCYAMKLAGTRLKHIPSRKGLTRDSKAGPVWTGEVRLNEEWLDQPLKWKRPRKIFVCAHGDLFAENVPDEWIDRVFAVMALAPQHTFQVLTKRAKRMRIYLSENDMRARVALPGARMMEDSDAAYSWLLSQNWPLPNVWLGVSAEDQGRADERIPDLLATPAAVRWVSAEPLLGPIDIGSIVRRCTFEGLLYPDGKTHPLEWIVAGGESGRGARPMHPAWARLIRDQCAASGVPFLFKQWGAFRPLTAAERNQARGATLVGNDRYDPDAYMLRVGKKAAGRLLDGVEHNGFPGVPA